jgi:hypothetical protein
VVVLLGEGDGDGLDDDDVRLGEGEGEGGDGCCETAGELPPVIRSAHPVTKAKITPTISGATKAGPTHAGILRYHGFGLLVESGWLASLTRRARSS